MGNYFSEEDVIFIMDEWKRQFPQGFEDALSIMRYDHGISDEEVEKIQSTGYRDRYQVAKNLTFYMEHHKLHGANASDHLTLDVAKRLQKIISDEDRG